MLLFRWLEQQWYPNSPTPRLIVNLEVFMGIGLYYGVLAFNLGVTFWIGEIFIGMVGCLIFLPVTALLIPQLWNIPAFNWKTLSTTTNR